MNVRVYESRTRTGKSGDVTMEADVHDFGKFQIRVGTSKK